MEKPPAPSELLEQATRWDDLTRWERAEVGRALRRLGWTYGEIRRVVPVPKGTLAGWCRDIRLTDEQVEAIKRRTGPKSRRGVPVDTQWKRRGEIAEIEAEARLVAIRSLDDPLWVAGTVLYWAEGCKTTRRLQLANSDPDALVLFIRWIRTYHDPQAEFVLALNLHHDNDELAAREYWRSVLPLRDPEFYKSFIKPDGTGHRKNHLRRGVCRVAMRRSTDAWLRTMTWIETLRSEMATSL